MTRLKNLVDEPNDPSRASMIEALYRFCPISRQFFLYSLFSVVLNSLHGVADEAEAEFSGMSTLYG